MIQGKVKEAMEAKGVTIRQMVTMTGLSSGTLHRARGEQFTKCTVETLAAIAGALGVKVKELFEEKIEGWEGQ
ncbi:MAG: hypothetical protein FD177_59 [Desulfovibrionaceae bacterium]|nr:MAG: hypothetical protein FD177_59 [Desulfovibrionaceae bacterium]